MKGKRLLALFMVVCMSFMLLTACGTDAPAQDAPADTPAEAPADDEAPADETPADEDDDAGLYDHQVATEVDEDAVVLRGMHWTSSQAEVRIFNEDFANFTEATGIGIEFEWFPEGYAERLITLFASGDSPDFFMNYVGDLGDRARRGFMLPITEFFYRDGYGDNDDLMESAIMRFQGEIYGVLPIITPQVMYYNKDMFDAVGLDYPTDDWTWQDLMDAADLLTERDGDRIVRFGFQCDEYNRVWLSHFWSNGGEAFDCEELPTEPRFNCPIGADSAQFLMDLVQSLGAAPPPGVQGVLGYRDNFQNGNVGIILDGSWMIASFARTEGLNFGVALVPMGSEGRGGWMAPSTFVVSSQTANPEESWQFIRHYFSYESSLFYSAFGDAQGAMGVPAWKSAYDDPRWDPDEAMIMTGRQAAYARTEMSFQFYGRWFWDFLNNGLQLMVANEEDPATALDRIADQTQREVIDEIDR